MIEETGTSYPRGKRGYEGGIVCMWSRFNVNNWSLRRFVVRASLRVIAKVGYKTVVYRVSEPMPVTTGLQRFSFSCHWPVWLVVYRETIPCQGLQPGSLIWVPQLLRRKCLATLYQFCEGLVSCYIQVTLPKSLLLCAEVSKIHNSVVPLIEAPQFIFIQSQLWVLKIP